MKWKICAPSIVAAFIGSALGARITLMIDEKVLKIAMLIVLPIILFMCFEAKHYRKIQITKW